MSVWDDVVGQGPVVEQLRTAAEGSSTGTGGMTHAWLFTGPPGSGYVTAARAFAAALLCSDAPRGCGHCASCHQVLQETHADVLVVRPQGLSFGIKEARELVLRAASASSGGSWRIVLFEEADRATEAAANTLLKSIEEPSARTVWLLCAPSPDDLLVTIRSRCRAVALRTPSTRAVADMLVARDGADPERAADAAVAAQGHIERARALATSEETQRRHRDVLGMPSRLTGVGQAVIEAEKLVRTAKADAEAITGELNRTETAEMRQALGENAKGRMPRGTAAALKELEERQSSRAKRIVRDSLDRALLDLASFYRDVLTLQLGSDIELINRKLESNLRSVAAKGTPEATLRRLDAIMQCRERLGRAMAPLLAVEAMALALRTGD